MKRTFELIDQNIEKETFEKLIDICFRYSSYFSFSEHFTKFQDDYRNKNKLKYGLEPFLIKKFKTTHWHCIITTTENPLNIFIYKNNELAKEIITKYFNNIYLRNNDGDLYDFHEDISFFAEKKLLLGTISHTPICNLYPSTEEQLRDFKNIVAWREIGFLEKEQIAIDLPVNLG